MSKEPTRRERRAAERRERILRAAAEVFAEKGFHRATTKEIADRADVAEGTIYNYFENKDALLVAIIHQLAKLDERQALIEKVGSFRNFVGQHFVDRIQELGPIYQMFLNVLPEILANPDLRQTYYNDFMKEAIEVTERIVAARIDKGDVKADIDLPLVMRLLAAMMYGLQILMVMGDEVVQDAWDNPERLSNAFVQMMFDGLSAEDE
jgi:AcrR family transcriptional regulator